MDAPRIIGMLKRKEYLAAVILSNPQKSPVAIVQPEREKPGRAAKPWARPINIDVFKSTWSFFASIFFDLYSLYKSVNPVMKSKIPTTDGV